MLMRECWLELTSLAEWRKDSVPYQWKIDLVPCQWRTDSGAFRCRTDLDHSQKSCAKEKAKIGMVRVALTRTQLVQDLLDVDLCSPDTTTNASESSVQAPVLIDNFVHMC